MGGDGASRNKIKHRRHEARKKKNKSKVKKNVTMALYNEIVQERGSEWTYGYKSSDDDDVPTDDESEAEAKLEQAFNMPEAKSSILDNEL